MYIFIFLSIYVHIYIYIFTCVYIYMYIYTYIYIYIYMCIYIYVHIYIYMYMYILIFICVSKCIYIHIYIDIWIILNNYIYKCKCDNQYAQHWVLMFIGFQRIFFGSWDHNGIRYALVVRSWWDKNGYGTPQIGRKECCQFPQLPCFWDCKVSTISCLILYANRRKFRSQTSDNMDRWKAEMGRVREKRRVEERR